ncbi:MAG TPA: 2Fe-2S iron-sulfur cluster binding domain-containing protein [Bradyrhizobium sp.]
MRARGRRFQVPTGKSILEVLEANHLNISFACREGLCATCETRVLAGRPDHRDSVLTASEKAANNTMMICVSRALSDELTLDLCSRRPPASARKSCANRITTFAITA